MHKNDWIYLSHTLTNETPGYGGQKQFSSQFVARMENGASCNQSEWRFCNHVGTHIDAPFHFWSEGDPIDVFPASFWVFNKPQLIELDPGESQIIKPDDWAEHIHLDCDLLLLKTGFETFRGTHHYWQHNPGLSPELGNWLRNERRALRAIGFDFISATSFDHRPLGRTTHHAFLANKEPPPVLIIEDMHLAELTTNPASVTVLPLRVEGADGSPVTIIAKI